MSYILIVAVLAAAYANPENPQSENAYQARQINYGSPQYPLDSQFEYTLIDPQIYYPPISGENTRLQPQVLLYPSGAPGQPFLLQPGAPPGNFLIPQPHPGVILRDAPQRPHVFVSGYPKPAHVPPINKDAEEIPTNPGAIPPFQPEGRRPEKLETFDIPEKPIAREPEELDSDNQSLKPGHRYFILNGQPLFSNYPLPQFAGSPFQPGPERIGQSKPDTFYRNSRPSFPPQSLNKPHFNEIDPYKGPQFLRNSINGQFNSAKPNIHFPQNDVSVQPNFLALNKEQGTMDFKQNPLFKSTVPSQVQNIEQFSFLVDPPRTKTYSEKLKPKQNIDFKSRPIEVPDVDDGPLYEKKIKSRPTQTIFYNNFETVKGTDGKDSVGVEDTQNDKNTQLVTEKPEVIKKDESSVSQAEPSATALAGPGGVASSAPRGTALTGDKGLAISSPQATAIAGPSKDEIIEKPTKSKKAKQ